MKLLTFDELENTDFYRFFNCTVSDEKREGSLLIKKLKPGGFQEFIDIEFHLTLEGEVVVGRLFLDRKWIGNSEQLNPFGKDIAKSFIYVLTPEDEKAAVKDLADLIFYQTGTKDKVVSIRPLPVSFVSLPFDLKKILDVYIGEYDEMSYGLSSSTFHFKNIERDKKQRLEIEWKVK